MKLDPTKKYKYLNHMGTYWKVLSITIVAPTNTSGVIIVCDDGDRYQPGYPARVSIEGCDEDGKQVVFEATPYDDWKIDDQVVITNAAGETRRRHFAGVDGYGNPTFFADGGSSWTTTDKRLLSRSETIKRVVEE